MVKRDKVLLFAGSVFASIYLTFIVDVYTLNTWPKRIFVFCYFLIMCHAAIFLKQKFLKDKQLPKHMLAIVGLLAAAVVMLGHNTFFPKAQETTVSLAAVPCEDGSYHEVWLTSMQVDGQEVQLSQLELDADQGWTYSGDYDDYVFYPTDGTDNTNYLTFKETGESIELTFAKNAWSGAVEVRANEKLTETISLIGSDDSNESESSLINVARRYAAWELMLYGMGAWLILTYFLSLLLSSINWRGNFKHRGNRTTWMLLGTIGVVVVWRIIFSQIFLRYIVYPDSDGYMNYPWYDFFHLNLTSGRTPVYPAFLAVIRLLFGEHSYLNIVPMVQSVISLISLIFLFRLLWILTHNDLLAGIVTTGYGVCPDIIVWDYSILTESLALSFTIIFIYLLVLFLKNPQFITGIKVIGLSVLMIFERPTFLLFAVVLFGFWILRMLAYKDERKMLLRLCIASLCTFLLVGLYSIGIHKNFGIYSISDAMPRQNVVTAIERGYYVDSKNEEFVEIINKGLEATDGDTWKTMTYVLDEFGLTKSNKYAKAVLFHNFRRYVSDTVSQMLSDAKVFFSEQYVYYGIYEKNQNNEGYDFITIDWLRQVLQLRIVYLYISELICVCMLVGTWLKRKEIPWLYIGLATFMAAIPVTTYIATCGEFNRTMIHVVPFVYVTFAMIIDWFVRASKQNDDSIQRVREYEDL